MIKIYLFYINKLRKKKTKIAGDGQKRKKLVEITPEKNYLREQYIISIE
jgi:hypothetical protein